jgi:peptidoglycan/xylan/chitin deacetylase (PgdA/CDA1 family)
MIKQLYKKIGAELLCCITLMFGLCFDLLGIFRLIRWLNRNRLTIISYHDPNPDVLEEHLKYLDTIYQFISIDKYCEIVKGKKKLPKYSLLITFDDGHKNNIKLLSVFIKYNIRPVIYLCSQIVGTVHPFWWKMLDGERSEKYKKLSNSERVRQLKISGKYESSQSLLEPHGLTKEDIKKLKGHVTFGSHTRTHPILTKCTNEEQEEEIIKSRIELEDLCGELIRHFSYPNGDYNKCIIEMCKKAGYLTARTIHTGWNGQSTDFFQLKMVGISDDADINKFRVQLSGVYPWLLYLLRYRSLNGRKKIL